MIAVRPKEGPSEHTRFLNLLVSISATWPSRSGSQILLDLKGPNVMAARVAPTLRMKVHDPVRLALNAERRPFFDTKTQLST
jgi:hypothetical protein